MTSHRQNILNKGSSLSEKEISEIMELYYSGFSLKDIQSEYELNGIQLSDLHYLFPPDEIKEKQCKYCGVNLFQYKEPRNIPRYYSKEPLFCPNCGHEDSSLCRCANCESEKKVIEEKETKNKINFLRKVINFEGYKPINYNDLTFKQKIFLGTFLRAGMDPNFNNITPINNYQGKIFPTEESLSDGFNELYDNHIIRISPQSNSKYFTPNYEKNTFSFDWKDIQYIINIYGDSQEGIIAYLLNPGIFDEVYTEESLNLWKEINYWECIDLLFYRMNAYDMDYTVGKETKAFFNDIINVFPMSQIYAIIWNAAKNAAAYYVESKVSKRQAANSVLSRMRNAADKIISGQWNRYDYGRPIKECPQSLLSEYFFNSILKICDISWEMVPCIPDKPLNTKAENSNNA